jgi:hypothetical protein
MEMKPKKKQALKKRASELHERSLQLKTIAENNLENELQKKTPNLEIIEHHINVIVHQSMQIEYYRLVSENKGFEALTSQTPEYFAKIRTQIKNSLYKKYNLNPNDMKL